MFAKPVKAATPVVTASKKSASAKPADTIEGWETLCAIRACYDALEALLDLHKQQVTVGATGMLIEHGCQRRGKPESLRLVDGDAAGSAYVGKKAVASPLTADDLTLLAEYVPVPPGGEIERDDAGEVVNVPGFTETREIRPGYLAVNPVYAGDEVLLQRIDKAVSGIKGVPEDFIVQIPAEVRCVVSDEATNSVFRLKAEVAAKVLPLIGRVTLKPVFKDIERAWAIVRPLLTDPESDPVKVVATTAAKKAGHDKLTAQLKASLAKEAA